jgi:predicted dehydrogenase
MSEASNVEKDHDRLDRRDFLQGLASVPVLGLFAYALNRQIRAVRKLKAAAAPKPKPRAGGSLSDIHVALLGAGAQGDALLNAMLKIPGLRFRAVCDIWKEYNQKKAANLLQKYGHRVNRYEDYRDMLSREKDLDAVVIATPDFWHADHAAACLEAGLHVYCEKEMSNTLEGAMKMARAARRTGRLLQIGHQRRSNPRYLHCFEKLVKETGMLGRIVTVGGQWNRSVQPDLGWPKKAEIEAGILMRYGYRNMHRFRNWRWYKGMGGGPIVDLGSHQIDIYNWFLDALPRSVTASGGTDYYDQRTHEWYDTVMAVFEYATGQGTVRAYYQTQTTNSCLGYFENFMGDQGTLVISESAGRGSVYREASAPAWDGWVRKGYLTAPRVMETKTDADTVLDVRETISPDEHGIPVRFNDPYHKPHLENFFNAVRGFEKLNCPAETGFETAVTVLKVNQAVQAGRRLVFDPKEFMV